MINLIKNPQRADFKVEYLINNDMLTIKTDITEELLDFTGLEDGVAEQIIIENLPINPIISVKKEDGIIDIEVIRFYTFEEKELFENGYN